MDLGVITAVDWSTIFDYLAVIIGAATGALFAVARKLDIVGTVAIGLITAYGGGALRDICTGQTPVIFKPGNFYAISAFLGAAFYVACMALGAPILLASIGCVVISFALTLLSRRFNWHTNHKDD